MKIIRVLLSSLFLGALFTGCSRPTPKPPEDCTTAMECVVLGTQGDGALCSTTYDSAMWYFRNRHPTKTVIITYNLHVRHVNASRPPFEEDFPNNTTEIGPNSRINDHLMACRRTVVTGTDVIDEKSYSYKACFKGECPSELATPDNPRDPNTSCEQLCDQHDASCFQVPLKGAMAPLGREMASLTTALAVKPLPVNQTMDGFAKLANAWSGMSTCVRDPLTVNTKGGLTAPGTSCQIDALVPGNPNITEFDLFLNGALYGLLDRPSRGLYHIQFNDVQTTPLIKLVQKSNGKEVYEPIISITGKNGEMTMTGKTYYCARFSFPRD